MLHFVLILQLEAIITYWWCNSQAKMVLNPYGVNCSVLGDRIRDHLYDIRKNDLSKPVSRHFKFFNHSINF